MIENIANSRNSEIDAAKGITILLVTLYHNTLLKHAIGLEFFSALGLVRMPMFFFLAGIFFNPFRQSWFINKARYLLVPYFWGNLLVAIVFGFKNSNSLQSLISFFYANGRLIPNSPLWFLPHLLLSFLVSGLILLITKTSVLHEWQKAFLLIIAYWVGSLTIGIVPVVNLFDFTFKWLPWGLDFVFITSFFILLGTYLRNDVITLTFRPGALIVAFLLFFSVIFLSDAELNLFNRTFINPIGVLVGALSGIYLLLMLAKALIRIKRIKEFIVYIGRASLIILILHNPVMKFINSSVPKTWIENQPGLVGLFSFIFCIAASLVLFTILHSAPRWFETFYGQLRMKNKT